MTDDILKGNYDLDNKVETPKTDEKAASHAANPDIEDFEEHALRKLGGSIAFVVKPKTFMWTGDDEGAE